MLRVRPLFCGSVECLEPFLKPGKRIGNEDFFEVPGKDVGAHDGATPAGEAGSGEYRCCRCSGRIVFDSMQNKANSNKRIANAFSQNS